MIIKNWLRGPWWDDAGVRHDGPVTLKTLPEQRRGIVGIVDCAVGSAVSQGLSPRGVPLFLCYPIRPDYPPCIVSVKEKHTKPLIVRVDYEHWEGKWPRAGITSVIGYVGDAEKERKAISLSAWLPRSGGIDLVVPSLAGCDVRPWKRVIHIDPVGCTDVDDICCWRDCDDGGIEFCVAIADVAEFVKEGSPQDVEALARGSTLYDDGVVVDPMLPTILSGNMASLRADGLVRPAVGIVYTLRNGTVCGTEWRQIAVAVQTGYTYESVLGTPDAAVVESAAEVICGRSLGGDSHLWIEALMIDYNRRAAEVLKAAGVGLLRSHSGFANDEMSALAARIGCAEIAFLGAASGLYQDALGAGEHTGLGLAVYTHASSPLRRYADLVNQRWLKSLLFGVLRPKDVPNLAFKLNERSRLIKKVERMLLLSKLVNTQSITEVTGFVVSTREGRVKVFCPTLRRTVRAVTQVAIGIGDSVRCRIFCDLKQCNFENRYVVQVI